MLDLYSAFMRTASCAETRVIAKNTSVHACGDAGTAWYVVSGVVRLDRTLDDGPRFAGLALPGDVIGVDACMLGCYADAAQALTPCVLTAWQPGPGTEGIQWLNQLAAQQRRQAEVLQLRCGAVEDRMYRLFALLQSRQGANGKLHLPSLRHIAEMLDITVESASRILSRWRQQGWIGARCKGQADFHLPPMSAEKVAA